MKIVKGDTYGTAKERWVDVTFSNVTISDVEMLAKLSSEKADVVVTEKKPIVQYYVAPRCNGKLFTQLVKEMKEAAVLEPFIDASVIKGGTLDRDSFTAHPTQTMIRSMYIFPQPKRIIRSGEYTTVLWKDGTKTIVKRMPGSEDSDYAAFTAALAKKVYGTNSNVERIVSMTERVKTKAEKKAEKKAKHKAESEDSGEKKYIVSQYGDISECNNLDGLVKTIIYAESKEDARKKAYSYFARSMNVYVVQSNGNAYIECGAYLADDFGKWCPSIVFKDVFWIAVFALSNEEALKVLTINPAPKEGDKQ